MYFNYYNTLLRNSRSNIFYSSLDSLRAVHNNSELWLLSFFLLRSPRDWVNFFADLLSFCNSMTFKIKPNIYIFCYNNNKNLTNYKAETSV